MPPRTTSIPPSVREFLEGAPYAHIVTLKPDGTPHVSLAWAGVDGDEIGWATFSGQRKIENLRRDPRIVISFEARTFDGEGLYPYLVVEGEARVTEGGSLGVMDDLAKYYIGPGAVYPMRDAPPGFVIHVTPTRFYGQGPWKAELKAER